jgi:hypothetical protein
MEHALVDRDRARGSTGEVLWNSSEEPGRRSQLPGYLAVAVTVALVLILRRTDGITNPQFWAEDGSVFFQHNLELGCWRALHTFFRGFPYLGQTLVACTATPFPLVSVPLVYNVAAYVIAAASLASFSLPSFRHVVRSDVLRVVFCLAVAALPQASELVASVTNTSWFLGIWLMLLTIMRLPRSTIALAALAVACLVATFSTPLSILTAPVWLVRGLHALRKRRRREAAFAAVALCGVLALIYAAGDLGRDAGPLHPIVGPLRESVSVVVLAAAALGQKPVLALADRFGPGVAHATALALLILLAVLAVQVRLRSLPVLLFCAYGIAASSALVLIGHPRWATLGVEPLIAMLPSGPGRYSVPGRYYVLAVSLVYLALLASVDRLPGRRSRSIAIVVLLAWLVATEAPTFVLRPFYDLDWPAHAAVLDRKRSDGNPDPLLIPINPDRSGFWFNIKVDERAMAPEVDVPRNGVVGRLVDTTLEQSFVARCPHLSEIALFLGKEGHAAGQTVHIQLREEETGRILATFALDAADIAGSVGPEAEARIAMIETQARRNGATVTMEVARAFAGVDNPYPLYFAPVPDSQDRRYVVTVTASGGTPGDTVIVLGSTADAYRDGEARIDGQPIPGDLAFRYGCSRQ